MRKLEIRNDDKPNVLLAAVAEMTRLCQRPLNAVPGKGFAGQQ